MIPIEKRLDILKVIAHPARIKILEELTQGVKCVSDFEDSLDISQPNVSQHLALLRATGLVEAERDGREIRYRLVDPDVIVACDLMRRVLERRLSRLGRLAGAANGGVA